MTSSGRFGKDHSMNSTHHMSCNQSYATNFSPQVTPRRKVLLNYAHIPIRKEDAKWNQSVATWRHSSRKHSFSKDSRFKQYKLNYTDLLEPAIPSALSTVACTFGKGVKRPISAVVLRNAIQKPSPDRYKFSNFDQNTRSPARGKSFGLGWKSHQCDYIKTRKDVYAYWQTKDNPPAQYNVRDSPGSRTPKYTSYGRLKIFSEKMASDKHWVPGPHHVINDRLQCHTVGLNDRSFTKGERMDLSKPANDYPGPSYTILGFCNKFNRIRHKHEKSTGRK